MGDLLKLKGISVRSSSCNSRSSSSKVASPTGNRKFAPRPDLDSQMLASPSPISSAKYWWAWLEKKGWLLNGMEVIKSQLSDIFFSASLTFKLPPEANIVIQSVAHIL